MEDILAIIFLFGGGTLVILSFSPLGKALAERIRQGKQALPAAEIDPALGARLAFADHNEQKCRHENMIGPPVDENHIMIGAQLATQLRRRHHTAATAA